MASFEAGSIIARIKSDLSGFKTGIQQAKAETTDLKTRMQSTGQRMQEVGGQMAMVGAVAAGGLYLIKNGIGQSLEAANRLQSSMIGLASIARAFGIDADAAKNAALSLASDGLMPVADAAASLKNLLAAGFSLPQAIELMNRFKDSAAFGRQGSLSFGEAIRGATEGIKNGNSILVDNAGVTKNLSMILQEAGFSAQDLMRASSDAGVRQAIFNGILKETNPMLGDAARLSETFAGSQATLTAQTEAARAKFGEALQPVLLALMNILTPIITAIGDFAQKHQGLTQAIVLGMIAFFGILAVIGAIGGVVLILGAAFASVSAGIVIAIAAIVGVVVFLAVMIARNFGTIKGWIGDVAGFLVNMFMGAVNRVVGAVSWIVNAFHSVVNGIRGALSAVWDAITSPFRRALDWVMEKVNAARDVLNKLNPFNRQSPSLVDWIRWGTDEIVRQYSGMTRDLERNMGGFQTGAVGALAPAAVASSIGAGGGSTNISVDISGIAARSRADLREIGKDIIEAVDEELRAKARPTILGGNA